METILNVSLPESLKVFVDSQVAEGGYATPDEYVRVLLESEQKRKARQRLEELLLEGLNSGPPTPMTTEDWAELRQQLESQFGNNRPAQ